MLAGMRLEKIVGGVHNPNLPTNRLCLSPIWQQRRLSLSLGMGVSHSLNLEKLPFCRGKLAVQCIFAWQLTGSRTI